MLKVNTILFPGNIKEYEKFKGYNVEIVDTERPDKGMSLDLAILETDNLRTINSYKEQHEFFGKMLAKGMEALVNLTFESRNEACSIPYGLPIRKAKE